MQRGWKASLTRGVLGSVSLTLAMCALGSVAVARADDVGCCEAECHSEDSAGRELHSMQRRPMTQAACESSFTGCETTWHAAACDAGPGRPAAGVRVGAEPGFGGGADQGDGEGDGEDER